MIDRRKLQAFHPFARLTGLLEGEAPGPSPIPGGAPILLSLGEPQRQPPALVAEELALNAADWSRYPPPRGTAAYRTAAAGWLQRRYDLPPECCAPGGAIDPSRTIIPCSGSREGLFFAALAAGPESADGRQPAILMPNPFYHVYAAAALAAGAEPVFVPATRENGHLPDFAALDPGTLDRAALAILCSPSNPQGAVADLECLKDLILLARQFNFVVAFDECYAEIYNGEPPPGALRAAAELGFSLEQMLVFHSLSKRSSAPGLRCAFAVGAPSLIDALEGVLRVGGAGVPLPILAAGGRLWQEEDHVVETRAFYRANFKVAEELLGGRFGFDKPEAGFFLWLDVGDGEEAARALWREAGIKVLPGRYICADGEDGGNPGRRYIRVALVHDRAMTEAALGRMCEIL